MEIARSVCSDRSSLSSLVTTSFAYSSLAGAHATHARALGSTPALAAARSSYRPAAKAHARIAEHLPLHPRTDPPCSHRRRVALEGTSSPYTAMSTSSQGAVLDRMDTTSHPSPGSQGDEPPPPPGPRDEAGAANGGNRPGPSHRPRQVARGTGLGKCVQWISARYVSYRSGSGTPDAWTTCSSHYTLKGRFSIGSTLLGEWSH